MDYRRWRGSVAKPSEKYYRLQQHRIYVLKFYWIDFEYFSRAFSPLAEQAKLLTFLLNNIMFLVGEKKQHKRLDEARCGEVGIPKPKLEHEARAKFSSPSRLGPPFYTSQLLLS
jgi:hypothetical protein